MKGTCYQGGTGSISLGGEEGGGVIMQLSNLAHFDFEFDHLN